MRKDAKPELKICAPCCSTNTVAGTDPQTGIIPVQDRRFGGVSCFFPINKKEKWK
jgi:hypothetical protein